MCYWPAPFTIIFIRLIHLETDTADSKIHWLTPFSEMGSANES